MHEARGARRAANGPGEEEADAMFIQVSQTTRKGRTIIRFAATPKSARTRALLAQFKKGVRAIEKKWKAHAAAARAAARKKAAGRRRRRR